MVDVGAKPETRRVAVAEGRVSLSAEAFRLVRRHEMAKGDVLAVARLAGIQGAKETSRLVPLCHPIPIDSIRVDLTLEPRTRSVRIEAEVATRAATGVEMEAMTAVSVAALTVYDMCKAVDRGITLGDVRLLSKSGGRSGAWTRARGARQGREEDAGAPRASAAGSSARGGEGESPATARARTSRGAGRKRPRRA